MGQRERERRDAVDGHRMLSRGLYRATRAVAGLEFALVLPMLLILGGGLTDLSLAWLTAQRLTAAAEATGLIATTLAAQASNLNKLSGQQAWQATTAPFATFPNWNVAASSGYSITLSAVNFTAKNGGYAGSVQWSVAYPAGQVVLRPCGAVASLPNGSDSMSGLPAGVFGPTSLLVADVAVVFTPPVSGVFTGPFSMLRSAYVSPRVNNGIQLTSIGPAKTVICG